MADTLSLFDMPLARATDPATSHAAARRMAPASPHLKAQILDVFGRYRCLTKDMVCERLGVDPRRWPSVASALSQLKNAGQLDWTGVVINGQNEWRLRQSDVDVRNGAL